MPAIEQKTGTRVSLNNVLFATDFSAAANASMPYALAICHHYDSTLHAVHVIPDSNIPVQARTADPVIFESGYGEQRREALNQMRQLSSTIDDIPHHTYVRRGKIWNVLSDIIAQQNIDLIVLGMRGRTAIAKLITGSVAEQLLRQVSCPVLTVGPKASGRVKEEFDSIGKKLRPQGIDFKQILFAVDFTPESLAAAPFAISLAEEFQSRLGLLHVIEGDQRTPCDVVLQNLESLVPEEVALRYRPGIILKFGAPAEWILKAASECESDLIVLGARAAKAPSGSSLHFQWPTTLDVIANASCPVLIVRK